ncbi:MAG: hypothetical protein U0996_12695 [Planctomycetaceae bacterium]
MNESRTTSDTLTDTDDNPYLPSPETMGVRAEEGFSTEFELSDHGIICHERAQFPQVCLISGESQNLQMVTVPYLAVPASSRRLKLVGFAFLLFPAIALGCIALAESLFGVMQIQFFLVLPWTVLIALGCIPFFVAAGFGRRKCEFRVFINEACQKKRQLIGTISSVGSFFPGIILFLGRSVSSSSGRLIFWTPFLLWFLVIMPFLNRTMLRGFATLKAKPLTQGFVEVTGLSAKFLAVLRQAAVSRAGAEGVRIHAESMVEKRDGQ